MASSKQLSLGPMALNSHNSAMPTAANLLGSASSTQANSVGSVDLSSVVLMAGDRLGMQRKELASIYGLSEADFSASFSPNRTDRNRLMKVALPIALARQIALQLCEVTGLAVGGPDAERQALGDLLQACASYIRVVQR